MSKIMEQLINEEKIEAFTTGIIPAGNEPSAVLARGFGECSEGL